MNILTDPNIQKKLQKEDLRYISDNTPGFFRQKFGKEFKYYDLEGKVIKDLKILNRIESLSIPPAWKNVWVCPKANGHLQATGIDEKKRKQYLYHQDWIKLTQQNKFSKMVDFGLNLPKIRDKVNHDLQSPKIDKRKVLATVIWLLENTFIRVGNEEYFKENNSFGLTTLRNKHVRVWGPKVYFKFKGKSGVISNIEVSNKKIAKTIKQCIELPGFELFGFIDEDGNRHVIDSEDVNIFLKDVTAHDFSAKDFRTWGATNLSAQHFYETGYVDDERILNKQIIETIKKVSSHLNNTTAVCRSYYIHPTVIHTYKNNILIPHFEDHHKNNKKIDGLSWDEYAVIKLLQKYPHTL